MCRLRQFNIYQKDSSTGWTRSLNYLQEQLGLPKIGLGVEEPSTPRMDTGERGVRSRATVVRRRGCRSLIRIGGMGRGGCRIMIRTGGLGRRGYRSLICAGGLGIGAVFREG
jgi:hypothetical protein